MLFYAAILMARSRRIMLILRLLIGHLIKKRDGCVIGEGSGIIVMEGITRAKSRGAKIMALISGYATTCDGINRIDCATDGIELARAIKDALLDAKVSPEEYRLHKFGWLGIRFMG